MVDEGGGANGVGSTFSREGKTRDYEGYVVVVMVVVAV